MSTQGQGQSTKTDGQTTETRVRGMTSQRKGESDLIWATVGRDKERKTENLKQRKRVVVPIYTEGHGFFLQTPTDWPQHRRTTAIYSSAVSDVAMISDRVHARANTAASINPYPTAFPYGNGMVLHFYQQQESSTTKTVHKVINKGLKAYV